MQEYAYSLRHLAGQAFVSQNYEAQEELVIEQFVNGLDNPDLKKHVYFTKPATLEATISAAVEFETFEKDNSGQQIAKPRAAMIKSNPAPTYEDGATGYDSSTATTSRQMGNWSQPSAPLENQSQPFHRQANQQLSSSMRIGSQWNHQGRNRTQQEQRKFNL